MISSQQTDNPTAHVQERARKCKVRTLTPFSYSVIPPESGKVERLVFFDLDQEIGIVRIDCSARGSGVGCEANTHSRLCAHAFAACTRLLANAKRREAVEQRDGKRNQMIREAAQKALDSMPQPSLEGIEQ